MGKAALKAYMLSAWAFTLASSSISPPKKLGSVMLHKEENGADVLVLFLRSVACLCSGPADDVSGM